MNRSLRGRTSFQATLLSLGLAFGGGCADTSQPQHSSVQPKAAVAVRATGAPAALSIPTDARPMLSHYNSDDAARSTPHSMLAVSPAAGIDSSPASILPRANIRGITPTSDARATMVREPAATVEVAQRPLYVPASETTDDGPALSSPAPAGVSNTNDPEAETPESEIAVSRGGTYQGMSPIVGDAGLPIEPNQPLYQAVPTDPVSPSDANSPTQATPSTTPLYTPAEIPVEPSPTQKRADAKLALPAGADSDPRSQWRLEDPTVQTVPPAQSYTSLAPAAARSPMDSAARQAVANRAGELVRHSYTLAERGAHFSARAELIQALRLIAQANDAERPDGEHSQALARGLQALREADDFAPRGSRLEGELDVAQIVVTHRTTVLKQKAASNVSPLVALQRYYSYAQQQFAIAGGNMPVASQALFGLGKIQTLLADGTRESQRLQSPKAMTYYQSALLVDGGNYLAANELGVMLAGYGQMQDARRVLLHSVMTRSHIEGWQNLAVVHAQLGEQDLAKRADYERQLLVAQRAAAGSRSPLDNAVQWVSPEAFAAGGAIDVTSQSPVATATRPAPPADIQRSGKLQR